MIKTILLLICSALVVRATDTVHFAWSYSDPIQEFRIYTGATPHAGENVFVIPADARRAGVEIPDNHYAWITARNNAGLESLPSPAVQYKPVTVELVVQQSKDLREWGGRVGVFIFRLPDAVLDTVEQRLNITKTHVEVRVLGNTYRVPIPTAVGKKFFRSFVAAQPL